MKKIYIIIFVAILLVGGIYYYNNVFKKGGMTATTNPTFGVTQVVITDAKISDGGKNYTMDITYPTVSIDFIDQDINSYVQGQITQFKKDIGTEVISPNWQNTLFINYEVVNNNDGLFSLKFDTELFTGGAHPNHLIITRNYDLKQKKLIAFENIVPDQTTLDKVADISLNYFKKQGLEFDLFMDGFAAKKENYNNFNLKKDSVIFYFQEYQIAPYVAGEQQIEIKLTDLKK